MSLILAKIGFPLNTVDQGDLCNTVPLRQRHPHFLKSVSQVKLLGQVVSTFFCVGPHSYVTRRVKAVEAR